MSWCRMALAMARSRGHSQRTHILTTRKLSFYEISYFDIVAETVMASRECQNIKGDNAQKVQQIRNLKDSYNPSSKSSAFDCFDRRLMTTAITFYLQKSQTCSVASPTTTYDIKLQTSLLAYV